MAITPPRTIVIIDPANVVEADPPPEQNYSPPPPGYIPTPKYFTFNEGNQPFTEAPNFAPIEIEPAEEGADITPVVIDPVE